MEDIIRSIREDRRSVSNSIWNNFCMESPSPQKASVKIISTNGIRCNRNVSKLNVAPDPTLQVGAFQNYSNPPVRVTNEVTGAGDCVPQPTQGISGKTVNRLTVTNVTVSKNHVKHFVPNSQTIPPRIEKERQTLFDDAEDGADPNLHTYDSHDPETLIDDCSDSEELEEFVRHEAEQEALNTEIENFKPPPTLGIKVGSKVSSKLYESRPRTVSQERKKVVNDKCVEKQIKSDPKLNKDNGSEVTLQTLNKITQLHERILLTILDLRVIIEEAPLVDDPLEIAKRRKRGLEFSIRFARNHLYQIGRLTQDVQRAMSTSDLLQKTLALHNGLVQGIQTYHKSIGSFIMNKNPEKLVGMY